MARLSKDSEIKSDAELESPDVSSSEQFKKWLSSLKLPTQVKAELESAQDFLLECLMQESDISTEKREEHTLLERVLNLIPPHERLSYFDNYLALLCYLHYVQSKSPQEESILSGVSRKFIYIFWDLLTSESREQTDGIYFATERELKSPEFISDTLTTVSWYWTDLIQNPSLIRLLPGQIQVELAQGKRFEDVFSLLSPEQLRTIRNSYLDYLMEQASEDGVATLQFTAQEAYMRLVELHTLFPEKNLPIAFTQAIAFIKRGLVVVFEESTKSTLHHEFHHIYYDQIPNAPFGSGLNEAMTDYLARRTLSQWETLWFDWRESGLSLINSHSGFTKHIASSLPFPL